MLLIHWCLNFLRLRIELRIFYVNKNKCENLPKNRKMDFFSEIYGELISKVSQNSKVYGLEKAEFVEAAFWGCALASPRRRLRRRCCECRNCELFHSRKDHFYDDKFAELEKKEAFSVSSMENRPFSRKEEDEKRSSVKWDASRGHQPFRWPKLALEMICRAGLFSTLDVRKRIWPLNGP